MQLSLEDFHFKFAELACLGSLASSMTLNQFFAIQKMIATGLSLRQALVEISNSKLSLELKENPQFLDEASKAVEICEKNNYQITYPGHGLYPENFLTIYHPPKLLTFIGDPAWFANPRISVVGSREMSSEAQEWMELYFDLFLRASRAVSISGAAFGVDQLVHRLSVRNCLPTIAFIPSGLSKVYPFRFQFEMESIVQTKGAVMSEFLPSQEMQKNHFERRNRLISALSDYLFVVEAKRKSGSLITARLALSQNKSLCVLTSSPMKAQNLGNLDLLFDGAHPLRDEKDLLAFMNLY